MQDAPAEALIITTREEADAAGAQIVALTLQQNAILAKKNRAEFAAQKLKGRMDELGQRMLRYQLALKAWAEQTRQQWGEKKTLELRHVVLNFKLAPRSIVLLKDWTTEMVLKALQRRPRLRQYIRIKREIDRQRLLADLRPDAGRLDVHALNVVGLGVAQAETFSIEPKLEPAQVTHA